MLICSRSAERGLGTGQYSLGKWITLLEKYGVISSSGKSVCSISFVTTILPLPFVARKRSGAVGTYGELTDLKFLGGNSFIVGLNDRDLVQKPICSTVGNVLCAVAVENVAVDSVPIPQTTTFRFVGTSPSSMFTCYGNSAASSSPNRLARSTEVHAPIDISAARQFLQQILTPAPLPECGPQATEDEQTGTFHVIGLLAHLSLD